MNKENLQKNLKCFLTAKVIEGKRVFKIVDGTSYPMSEAHVFFEGYTTDLGETISAFVAMGKAIEQQYCDWYMKNRYEVTRFYQNY